MSKRVATRVNELEQRIGNSDAIGVKWEDKPLVKVQHTGEELELSEWWRKYPDGTLIFVCRRDKDDM